MSSRFLALVGALLLATGLGWYAYEKPVYDWDMLAYAAIQFKWQGLSDEEIHRVVYNEMLRSLGDETVAFLSAEEFDQRAKASSEFFNSQLPFYTTKPLYNALVGALVYVGFTPLEAMRMLSAVGYAALLLLMFWLLSYAMPHWYALLFTALVGIMPVVMITARMLTPDMLSSTFVMGALVVFVVKTRYDVAMLLLVLSIGLRPDNALAGITAAIVFAWFNPVQRMKWRKAIMYVVACLVVYFGIAYWFNGYGWKITFQHSIIDLAKPVDEWNNVPLTAPEYFTYLLKSIQRYQLVLIPAMLLTVLSLFSTKALNRFFDGRLMAVVIVLFVVMVGKHLAFPRFDVRYHVVPFVFAWCLIAMALVRTTTRKV